MLRPAGSATGVIPKVKRGQGPSQVPVSASDLPVPMSAGSDGLAVLKGLASSIPSVFNGRDPDSAVKIAKALVDILLRGLRDETGLVGLAGTAILGAIANSQKGEDVNEQIFSFESDSDQSDEALLGALYFMERTCSEMLATRSGIVTHASAIKYGMSLMSLVATLAVRIRQGETLGSSGVALAVSRFGKEYVTKLLPCVKEIVKEALQTEDYFVVFEPDGCFADGGDALLSALSGIEYDPQKPGNWGIEVPTFTLSDVVIAGGIEWKEEAMFPQFSKRKVEERGSPLRSPVSGNVGSGVSPSEGEGAKDQSTEEDQERFRDDRALPVTVEVGKFLSRLEKALKRPGSLPNGLTSLPAPCEPFLEEKDGELEVDCERLFGRWYEVVGYTQVTQWLMRTWLEGIELPGHLTKVYLENLISEVDEHPVTQVADAGHIYVFGLPNLDEDWLTARERDQATERSQDLEAFQEILSWVFCAEARCRRLFASDYAGRREDTVFREWVPQDIMDAGGMRGPKALDKWLCAQAVASLSCSSGSYFDELQQLTKEHLLARRSWELIEGGKLFPAKKVKVEFDETLRKHLEAVGGFFGRFFDDKSIKDSHALWGVGTGRKSACGLYSLCRFENFEAPESGWFDLGELKNLDRPKVETVRWATVDEYSPLNWQMLPPWAFRTLDGLVFSLEPPLFYDKTASSWRSMDTCDVCGMYGHKGYKCQSRGKRFKYLCPASAGVNPRWDAYEVSGKYGGWQRLSGPQVQEVGDLTHENVEDMMKGHRGMLDPQRGRDASSVRIKKGLDTWSKWINPPVLPVESPAPSRGWRGSGGYASTTHGRGWWSSSEQRNRAWDVSSWSQGWRQVVGRDDTWWEEPQVRESERAEGWAPVPRPVAVLTPNGKTLDPVSERNLEAINRLDDGSHLSVVVRQWTDSFRNCLEKCTSVGEVEHAKAGLMKDLETKVTFALKNAFRQMVASDPALAREVFGTDQMGSHQRDSTFKAVAHALFSREGRTPFALKKSDRDMFGSLNMLGLAMDEEDEERVRILGVGQFVVSLADRDFQIMTGNQFKGTRTLVAVNTTPVTDASGSVVKMRTEGVLTIQTSHEVDVTDAQDRDRAASVGLQVVASQLLTEVVRTTEVFAGAIGKLGGYLTTSLQDVGMERTSEAGVSSQAGRSKRVAPPDAKNASGLDKEEDSTADRSTRPRVKEPVKEEIRQDADVPMTPHGVDRSRDPLEVAFEELVEPIELQRRYDFIVPVDLTRGAIYSIDEVAKAESFEARLQQLRKLVETKTQQRTALWLMPEDVVFAEPLGEPESSWVAKALLFTPDGAPVLYHEGQGPATAKRDIKGELKGAEEHFSSLYQDCFQPDVITTSDTVVRVFEGLEDQFGKDAAVRAQREFLVDHWKGRVPTGYLSLLDKISKGWVGAEDALAKPWIFRHPNSARRLIYGGVTPDVWHQILRAKYQTALVALSYKDQGHETLEYTVYFQCLGCGGSCHHTREIPRPSGLKGKWDVEKNDEHKEYVRKWFAGRDLVLDHMSVADISKIVEPGDWHALSDAWELDADTMVRRFKALGVQELYRRYHHGGAGCDLYWERFGARLCSVLGVIPAKGMHHYGLGKERAITRQQAYRFRDGEPVRFYGGTGCRYPVKQAVLETIGDVRNLVVLAYRILERHGIRVQYQQDAASKSRYHELLELRHVVRARVAMVHWNSGAKSPNYSKESTNYRPWQELPDSFEDYAELLGVKKEDWAKGDPFLAAYGRLVGESQKPHPSGKDARGLLYPPAEGAWQWYSVVELDVTDEFRERMQLGKTVVILICQDQLVAATPAILRPDRYTADTKGSMFEAWTMDVQRVSVKAGFLSEVQRPETTHQQRKTEALLLGVRGSAMDLLEGATMM